MTGMLSATERKVQLPPLELWVLSAANTALKDLVKRWQAVPHKGVYARLIVSELERAEQEFDEALRNPLRGPVRHADELLEALTAFANWRMPTVRDWECGALRDEFARMQRTARAVIAKATGAQS